MGRHKKSTVLKVKTKIKDILVNFFSLHQQALLHPQEFSKRTVKRKKLVPNLSFFLANLFIATLTFSIVRLFPFQTHSSVIFISFEAILRYLIWISLTLIIILIVNLLAKTLQGQTNLKITTNAIFLLSTPVIFLGIRFLQPLAFLYIGFLFLIGLKSFFKFSYMQSFFVMFIPISLLLLILYLLEFISLSPMFWLHF